MLNSLLLIHYKRVSPSHLFIITEILVDLILFNHVGS